MKITISAIVSLRKDYYLLEVLILLFFCFSLGFRLPPIHQQTDIVVNNIALRLKTITLNPFPTTTDTKIYESFQNHDLLTLRSAQKYFIPSRSYVQPETVK